jgi:NAD-dependent dihydropyrimidine dehydrogenase PreA subunit
LIAVYAERCNGCGACLDVCPHGALFLLEGKAAVDEALCKECEACMAVCPTGAIVITEQEAAPAPVTVPAVRAEPEVVSVESYPAPLSLRARVLPVVGAAVSWAGRELVPRLAYYLLDGLDRRVTGQPSAGAARGGRSSGGSGNSGRRQRRRHRGGRAS